MDGNMISLCFNIVKGSVIYIHVFLHTAGMGALFE